MGSLRFGQASGVLFDGIKKAVSAEGYSLMKNGLVQYGKTVGTQTALGTLQEVAKLVIDTAAAFTSGKNGAVPTSAQLTERLGQAVADSFAQSAVLGAAAEGVKVVTPWVVPKTVKESLGVLKQMAENPDAKLSERVVP